nr:MAG TPA: hypothetical protein [Caudoviricetes sp.]
MRKPGPAVKRHPGPRREATVSIGRSAREGAPVPTARTADSL